MVLLCARALLPFSMEINILNLLSLPLSSIFVGLVCILGMGVLVVQSHCGP